MQLFLEPRSVVLIGVSRQSGPGAYNNLEVMLRYGYQGRIHVVHPKVPEILGHRTYARVGDLPEVPDLAVISVGRDRVLSLFAECIEKGIRQVIIISQGFADADDHGKELQGKITEMARNSGTRVMGPNTLGVVNPFLSFSTGFVDIHREASPPPLAVVVQSGVFQVGFESFTHRMGKGIDIGNTSDLDFVDVLEFLETDPQTEVIVLHVEGMKRGRDFLRVAARVAEKKPIIVFKAGRSAAGAKGALSHTGAIVGEDAISDAAFEKAGLIRVYNMIELQAVSRAFIYFRTMAGPNLGVVTASGACGIMTADGCEDYGLELAPFPEQIREGLEIPHIAWHRLNNPVDIWPLGMVGSSFADVFKRAVIGLVSDDRVHAVLGIGPSMASPIHADLSLLEPLQEVSRVNVDHKPIALWLYGGDQLRQEEKLWEVPDVACFGSIDEAVMGLAALWRYRRNQGNRSRYQDIFAPVSGCPSVKTYVPEKGVLLGDSTFPLLAQYSIPLAPGKVAVTAEKASFIAGELGYPVVLKIVSPEWLHKSDLGGIRLDIASEVDLQGAFFELEGLFRRKTPSGTLEGILVQKQLRGTELLLGIKRDPQFGAVVVVGMGGIYTEVFRDVARSIAPVSPSEAESMLRKLRMFPILEGVRGEKGANLQSLIESIVSLSRLAKDHPEINELDINPMTANAEGCWCVDCRIVIDSGSDWFGNP